MEQKFHVYYTNTEEYGFQLTNITLADGTWIPVNNLKIEGGGAHGLTKLVLTINGLRVKMIEEEGAEVEDENG